MEETPETAATTMSCPDCHAVVANLDAHERWHSRVVSDIATAVVKELHREAPTR